MTLTLNEYQKQTAKTAHYPKQYRVSYPIIGLLGEAGELANKYKKRWRGDANAASDDELVAELGDVLWYVAAIARDIGADLAEVAQANIEKTHGRAARGQLKGSGDVR